MCKSRWWLSVEVGGDIELGPEFPRGERAPGEAGRVHLFANSDALWMMKDTKVYDCYLVSHDLYAINDKG